VVLSAHSALQGGEAILARLVRIVLYIGSKIIKKVLFFIIGVCVCVCVCVSVYGIISDRCEPSYFFTTIFFFVAAAAPPPPAAPAVFAASVAVAHLRYSVSSSSKSLVHNACIVVSVSL